MQTGKVKMESKIHAGSIADLQMSTDVTHFVTASFDNMSKLVDTQTLEVRCMVYTHAVWLCCAKQCVRAVYAIATLSFKQAYNQVMEHAYYCSELLRGVQTGQSCDCSSVVLSTLV